MDGPVLHSRVDCVLHQAVLLDPAQALELGGADDRAEVISAALVQDLDLGARKRLLDQPADLVEVRHDQAEGTPARATSTISSTRTNFTRGRASGRPRSCSAWSIASQPA
jgi:hypothetical protein